MKKISIFLVLMMVSVLALSGCGGEKEVAFTTTTNLLSENEVYSEYEIICSYDDKDIYGVACVPASGGDEFPTVIFSHGFRGNLGESDYNAHELAGKGIASYRFDFYGGSPESKSGGDMTEMSIFTEKSDLEAVLAMVKDQDFVDKENLYLFGISQGGAVSAITANDNEDEIKGLILLYPALCIPEDAREMYASVDDIPETVRFMGVDIGKTYYEEILDYDIYEEIDDYKKDVLIMHGDKDTLVDISYSEKAVEVYDSAELVVLENTGHGSMTPEIKDKVVNMIYEFISE